MVATLSSSYSSRPKPSPAPATAAAPKLSQPSGNAAMLHQGGGDQQPAKENTRGYQEPQAYIACILGEAQAPLSNRHFKRVCREINAVLPKIEATQPLKWSEYKISFDANDHTKSTRDAGTTPHICTPTINNITLTKTLLDGGEGLNVISIETFEKL